MKYAVVVSAESKMAQTETLPEYATLEDFVEYLLDDERVHYTVRDLALLAESLGLSTRLHGA